MKFRSMTLGIPVDLFRAMERGWKRVPGRIACIHGEALQVNTGFTGRSNRKSMADRYINGEGDEIHEGKGKESSCGKGF